MKKNYFLVIVCTGLIAGVCMAEDAPRYQQNILTIPRVDTQEKPGQYQNVQFKLAADGRWDLIHVSEAKLAHIDTLKFLTFETFPVQIHASISGYFPSGCYGLGQVDSRRNGNQFEIAVYQVELQTFAPCTQALVPFDITVPLDVFGLTKGVYQVTANGLSNSFELTTDNFFQSTSGQ